MERLQPGLQPELQPITRTRRRTRLLEPPAPHSDALLAVVDLTGAAGGTDPMTRRTSRRFQFPGPFWRNHDAVLIRPFPAKPLYNCWRFQASRPRCGRQRGSVARQGVMWPSPQTSHLGAAGVLGAAGACSRLLGGLLGGPRGPKDARASPVGPYRHKSGRHPHQPRAALALSRPSSSTFHPATPHRSHETRREEDVLAVVS